MLGFGTIARKVFGSANDRKIKPLRGRISKINDLEASLTGLSDDALRARTDEFRQQLANGAKVDSLLEDSFATVREVAKRTLGQRHFDVQLLGGMVLHQGNIAEMKTGEGKTLVATLPVYLNALSGKGVHVVTVNDYLARRDAEWMGQIYNFLGLQVGCVVPQLDPNLRSAAYQADITYGTNNEFGFDYLRDNLSHAREGMVQRDHHFAVVDEVDSILIDEARTPLIISGPTEDHSELYRSVDALVAIMAPDHFEVDEKTRSATLTDDGNEFAEQKLGEAELMRSGSMYDIENVSLVHHINQALKAHQLFQKDRDYIVKNDSVVIIDEFTGRMMEGRRYSEGLHQAIEAKENVTIQAENQTLAQVTFQNYFRLYDKLAGMTGTALTEADEFMETYKLNVMEIPTNVPVGRIDDDDEVYRTADEKFNAITEEIETVRATGQPILVGTTSIEKSEVLSELLKKKKIKHNVLNARHHEQEAYIVAQAGRPGAVTIATNMAGRGTDIQLGGNLEMRLREETAGIEDEAKQAAARAAIEAEIAIDKKTALDAGGLYVLATERHESRRIDNQLRGRSGRQGDPGKSKFYLSLQDDLMRIFASERMDGMLQKLGLKGGEAIVHPWISKAVERAQGKVEARNFDIRKHLLKYDDVMNNQRKAIFEQRRAIMDASNVADTVQDMRQTLIEDLVSKHIPENSFAEQWDSQGLQTDVNDILGIEMSIADWAAEEGMADEELKERIIQTTNKRAAERAVRFGPDVTRKVEKSILLQTIDHHWREHLVTLEHLSKVVGFRGYGQRDPLNEYKSEAFELFEALLSRLRRDVTGQLMNLEIQIQPMDQPTPEPLDGLSEIHRDPQTGNNEMTPEFDPVPPTAAGLAASLSATAAADASTAPGDPASWGKIGRNQPCPCESGKKYKHCHGALG